MTRLAGKRAFITAAGQGIGRACAERFSREGAQVIATDIQEDLLSSLDAQTHRLDVTDGAAISALAAQIGPVDILFNCAGWVHAGSILDCDETDWQRSLDINMTAMYRVAKAFLPSMLYNGGGTVINMASVASSITATPNRFAYSATKAGVIGMTKAIAADFVKQGIRCNAICPGTVDSPSLHDRLRATGDYERAVSDFTARQPMGRLGKTEEIAELATYLASDAAGFTTGAIHVIDGGWSM